MPPPYQNPHWNTFVGIPYQAQGAVGAPPSQWAARYGLQEVPDQDELPNFQLDRASVRAICMNPNNSVLFGYVCAMAWGGQRGGAGGQNHVISAWNASAQIAERLTAIRDGEITRIASYNLFCAGGALAGLGPSFFTKLLYFFSPIPACYIMDQWTAKSVNLLNGNWVVRMAGDAPSNLNTGGNYQAFCEEIDLMAGLIGCSGQLAEERLFSQGGHNPWPWRRHLRINWPSGAPVNRYSATTLNRKYPHIALADF